MPGPSAEPRLPRASRVHSPRKVLLELQRVRLKADRAAIQRARTEAERTWCLQVADLLEQLAKAGAKVVTDRGDPRERRRVRKRQPSLFVASSE